VTDFCHLHAHGEYSLLDGMGKAGQYARRAKEIGCPALALTDHGTVSGVIKHQQGCEKEGIQPIVGCEMYIVPDALKKEKGDKRGHITVLVKREAGFQNLLKMLSFAYLEGFYRKPRVDFQFFLNHCDDLVVMTACMDSFILLDGGEGFLAQLHSRLKGDLYLEVMPHDMGRQKELNERLLAISDKRGIPLVATNDCHYVMADDAMAQEVLLAIQRKAKWGDKDRWRFNFTGLHLRTAEEMRKAFGRQGTLSPSAYESAMAETVAVAEKCSRFRIRKKPMALPPVAAYGEGEDNVVLEDLCRTGFRTRFGRDWSEEEAYGRRLASELKTIKGKEGFARYFLIVADLVDWCKRSDIMIGPGRGSVGGSLVAYVLGITSVDPLVFGLSFDRFINENRIDLPDIDLDFEDRKRDRVFQRLRELYGDGSIAGISTFIKMKNRAVVRDVGRVFEVPYRTVDTFAKTLDDSDDLEAVFQETDEGRSFSDNYPDVARLCVKLQGQVRGLGRHAAAAIISPEDLSSGYRANLLNRDGDLSINWDMDDAEYVGLMKLDVLGLNELSVLHGAQKLIRENHGKDLKFEEIPLDDAEVLKDINDGNTVGIFQVSTRPMTRLIGEMGITSFQHLCDALALVRPGPFQSGMTADYVKRKHGRKWKALHPVYEDVTKNTYGVVVYQEQVMGVISRVAGLSYSVADQIRKVIGKKRSAKEFKPFKDLFIKGCEEQGTLSRGEAEHFWEGLKEHAHYGFNLSHSTEYAMIAVWCAYLKHYYPVEFLCAALSYGGESKKEELVKEARRLGLEVVPPKVGKSDAFQWIGQGGKLYIPFIEVKGIGEKTAKRAAAGTSRSSSQAGFFSPPDINMKRQSGLHSILSAIGAFGDDLPVGADKYFDFDVVADPRLKCPKLYRLLGSRAKGYGAEELVAGQIETSSYPWVRRSGRRRLEGDVKGCKACELRGECDFPVRSCWGQYNLCLYGEAPGPDEDRQGKGFVGRAGQLLWKELNRYRLDRGLFHVGNVVKCYPGKAGTPKKKHIDTCRRWLDRELEIIAPFLILAMGNTCVRYFRGQEGGIEALSGKTEWREEVGAWICWCVHPAAALRNPAWSGRMFEEGIRNFSKTLKRLGGF